MKCNNLQMSPPDECNNTIYYWAVMQSTYAVVIQWAKST